MQTLLSSATLKTSSAYWVPPQRCWPSSSAGCVPGLVCSLLHEFSHLVLHTEGLCDVVADDRPRTEDRLVEARCNAIARSLWALIEEAISAGQIRSVDEVQRELARRDDDGKRWADTQSDLFSPLDGPIQDGARQILRVAPTSSGRVAGEVPPTRS